MDLTAILRWVPTGSQLALCQPGQTGVSLCLNQRAGRLLETTGPNHLALGMCKRSDHRTGVEEGGTWSGGGEKQSWLSKGKAVMNQQVGWRGGRGKQVLGLC